VLLLVALVAWGHVCAVAARAVAAPPRAHASRAAHGNARKQNGGSSLLLERRSGTRHHRQRHVPPLHLHDEVPSLCEQEGKVGQCIDLKHFTCDGEVTISTTDANGDSAGGDGCEQSRAAGKSEEKHIECCFGNSKRIHVPVPEAEVGETEDGQPTQSTSHKVVF